MGFTAGHVEHDPAGADDVDGHLATITCVIGRLAGVEAPVFRRERRQG
jgi:hypothetical protein